MQIFLTSLILVGLSFQSFAAPKLIDRLEASVNGKTILKSDIVAFRRSVDLRTKLDPIFARSPLGNKGKSASDAEIVQYLTDEKLIASVFPISDTEAEQQINQIQNSNKISRAKLISELENEGFIFDDYFEIIKASVSRQQLIEREIAPKAIITENDIKNFYINQQPSNAEALSKSHHILLMRVPVSEFKTREVAKQQADRKLEESKKSGTLEADDLGFLTEDQINPTILAELKKLSINQISPVFSSSNNQEFLAVKLLETKIGTSPRFEKLKEEIRMQLVSAEYQRQLSLWLERQRVGAVVHKASSQ